MPTPTPPRLDLAPWVIQHAHDDQRLLLGPRWGAYQLDADVEPAALDPEQRRELVAAGVLTAEVTPPVGEGGHARPPGSRTTSTLRVVSDDPRLARALEGALHRHAPAALRVDGGRRPVVLLAAAEEDLNRLAARARPWLRDADILCFGEGREGLHCGPWLRRLDDVERYRRVLRDTTWAHLLRERSLPPRWPTSLPWQLARAPERVAAAVACMMQRPDHDCVLVDALRPVDLWTRLEDRPATVERFLERQRWSKGAMRWLEVERLEPFDAYVAHASSPCAGEPHLGDNFGKGVDPRHAERVALGETVERLAAWFANALPECPPDELPARHYSLADFHPNGPAWDEYLARGAPPVPARVAWDPARSASVGVPSFLVPFPFTDRRDPLLYRLDGHTSGLATYPTRTGAVLRAALELLERHDLYPRFLHQRAGIRVALEDLPAQSRGPGLTRVLEQLAREPALTVYVLRYPEQFGVPIAHAFLHDAERGFVCRGSGSGVTLWRAAERALLECLLGRRGFTELDPAGTDGGPHVRRFREWARPPVVERVLTYLKAQPSGPATAPSFDDEDDLLAHIIDALDAAGHPLLVVDLPCPIAGWSAVRVLSPGLTTHQIPSDSAGGRRLRGAAFPFGIPT